MIGPLWVRCSFSVQSAKAEGAVSCDVSMTNGPFLLVNGESVPREGVVDRTDLWKICLPQMAANPLVIRPRFGGRRYLSSDLHCLSSLLLL